MGVWIFSGITQYQDFLICKTNQGSKKVFTKKIMWARAMKFSSYKKDRLITRA